MALLSKNRIKKIRERFTGRIRYVAESQIKTRRGKQWIKINPCLLRRAHLYQGSRVSVVAKVGVQTVVIRRSQRVKGKAGRVGIY